MPSSEIGPSEEEANASSGRRNRGPMIFALVLVALAVAVALVAYWLDQVMTF